MAGKGKSSGEYSDRVLRSPRRKTKSRHNDDIVAELARLANLKLKHSGQFKRFFNADIELYWDDDSGFDSQSFEDDFVKSVLHLENPDFVAIEHLYGKEAVDLLYTLMDA